MPIKQYSQKIINLLEKKLGKRIISSAGTTRYVNELVDLLEKRYHFLRLRKIILMH